MTEPPRTLQERLRVPVYLHSDPGFTNAERREAAAALDAQSQLLAEARKALEPFAKLSDKLLKEGSGEFDCFVLEKLELSNESKFKRYDVALSELRKARAVLAKLKAATPPAEGDER